MKKISPPQEHIGVFALGWVNVDVYAMWNEAGGEFYHLPDSKSLPRIKIGMDHGKWEEVLNVILHEAFEYAADNYQCRYKLTGRHTGNSADFQFVMDHQQFAEITGRVAAFLDLFQDNLKAKWLKVEAIRRAESKKKAKRKRKS